MLAGIRKTLTPCEEVRGRRQASRGRLLLWTGILSTALEDPSRFIALEGLRDWFSCRSRRLILVDVSLLVKSICSRALCRSSSPLD